MCKEGPSVLVCVLTGLFEAGFVLTGLDELGETYVYKSQPKPFDTKVAENCVVLPHVLR